MTAFDVIFLIVAVGGLLYAGAGLYQLYRRRT